MGFPSSSFGKHLTSHSGRTERDFALICFSKIPPKQYLGLGKNMKALGESSSFTSSIRQVSYTRTHAHTDSRTHGLTHTRTHAQTHIHTEEQVIQTDRPTEQRTDSQHPHQLVFLTLSSTRLNHTVGVLGPRSSKIPQSPLRGP